MKKLLYPTLVLTSLMGLASCASDAPEIGGAESKDGVKFVIDIPANLQTRATFGDTIRATLDNLQWSIYEVDGTVKSLVANGRKDAFKFDQSRDSVTLALVKGKTYQIAFYADNNSNKYATFAEGKISVDYTLGVSNDVQEDAFVGTSSVLNITGTSSETVVLKRPFSQLNWGTDDLDEATVQKYLPTLTAQVQVSKGLYKNYEVITGEVSNPVANPIIFNAVPYKEFDQATFPVKGYTLINMNYLLTGKGTIDCRLIFNNGINPVVVNNAAVNNNYRTNIYGSLITAPFQFNILVLPGWDDDNDIEVEN